MPRTTPRSGAAERTARSGQHRSWHSGTALLGLALLLTGCAAGDEAPAPSTADGGAASTTGTAADTAEDPALSAACTAFWGDPDYVDPLARTVLDRAATAPEVGPSDPYFYALTGDDVEAAFDGADESAQRAAAELADWFRTQPERGAEADRDAFRSAWEGVGGSCLAHSAAARWALAPGEDGTKPAALVCADVFDTPSTLTHFANANVLTSNMFKLVGLSPREVPADREEDVRATAALLEAEIAAVDDDGVRTALEQVRAPFRDALDGDTWSEGLRGPLTELGDACEAVGYSSPAPGEDPEDAVVGASAGHQHSPHPDDTHHGGRS